MRDSQDQLLKQIMSLILEVPFEDIHENSSMDSIESWDSLRHMNLVLALESEFKISIPDDEVTELTSFRLLQIVISELTSK